MQYILDNVITARTAAAPEKLKITRDLAAQSFNQTKDLKTYTEDMSALDTIEDMFYIRKEQFEGVENDGIADAFAETNPSGKVDKSNLVKKPPKED